MHFIIESDNDKPSHTHAATTSTSSSTSSTDSGVIIIDNRTAIAKKSNNINTTNNNNNNNSNNSNNSSNNNKNNNKINNTFKNANVNNLCRVETSKDKIDNPVKIDNLQKNGKFNNETNESTKINQPKCIDQCDKATSQSINIENFININKIDQEQQPEKPKQQQLQQQSQNNLYNNCNISNCNNAIQQQSHNTQNGNESKNCSPNVSLRSTSISIVSIDENAVDSSFVDSDSDIEADAEGIHTNYVVKKLGQQTTYPAGSTDLPHINKGLTMISQQIQPDQHLPVESILNGGFAPPTRINAGPMTPTTPQIGSIALTNSTDVTFGDKHFYEGPVTIQQILIDRRDKWKADENGGHDNPMFAKESDYAGAPSGSKVNSSPSQAETPYSFLCKRKAILITATIVVLTILVTAIVLTTTRFPKSKQQFNNGEETRKNIPINSTIAIGINGNDDEDYDGELHVMSRADWMARVPKTNMDKLDLPVHRVIISHTASDICLVKEVCVDRVRVIQDYHMDSMDWDDIGYNFLIGGDGRVYSARGWDNQGAHTKGYNKDSIGISFIGTFTTIEPTKRQVLAAKFLIEEGVRLRKIAPDFHIYGARQLGATESPGEALFRIIKTWPHWSESIK